MNILVKKGDPYHGKYTATEIALATDWTGTASVYRSYPGTAIFSKPLTLVSNELHFTFDIADILNLDAGVYYVVGNFVSAALGVDTSSMDNMTVTAAEISGMPMTTISMTIAKVDGTPAGREARIPVNEGGSMTTILGWQGVTVTASHPAADEITGIVIGTEMISTETNAAGYAQMSVIKGQTVTVSCPAFGKSVTVDTTGLDSIDLSSHF